MLSDFRFLFCQICFWSVCSMCECSFQIILCMTGWADHWKHAWYSIHPWGGSRSVRINDSCVCSSQRTVSILAAWCSDSLSCKPISTGCCPGLRCSHDCTSSHECHFKPRHSLTRHLMNINLCPSTGLDFIRAEGFVFSHVADEGLLNACAGELLRYCRHIGAEHVQIFTDIKKKHRYLWSESECITCWLTTELEQRHNTVWWFLLHCVIYLIMLQCSCPDFRCEHSRDSPSCRVLPLWWSHRHRNCHWSTGWSRGTEGWVRIYFSLTV